jgi:O-antigen/teichoic acid export membrane protein
MGLVLPFRLLNAHGRCPPKKATGRLGVTRVRRLFAGVRASSVRFAVNVASSLVAVPVYLHFLGKEEYGLWLAVLSVLMPLSLMSIGFPTISQNLLAEARAVGDWDHASRVLATSFGSLLAAAVSACLLMLLGLRVGLVQELLKASPVLHTKVVPALLIALAGFALSQPLQVFRLAFRAFERVDLEQYGLAALGVINLSLTILVLWTGQGIIGVAVVYAVLQLAGGAVFYSALTREFPQLHFSVHSFSPRIARRMIPPGFHFFVVSVSGVLMWGIDNLVISGVLGVVFVTAFAIAARLMSMLREMLSMPFSTSGPTITALGAEGNQEALRRLFYHSTRLALFGAMLFCIELSFFGQRFIALWAGPSVVVDSATFAALVGILVVNMLQQPAYAYLIATTRHRTFAWLSLLEGIANLALSFWWVHKWGVLGVALGTLVPHALVSGPYLVIAGTRMNGFTVAELWRKNIQSLIVPAMVTTAAAYFLRNFSATWLEWAISCALTMLVFVAACWTASATPEERGMLVGSLRTV